MLSCNSIRWGLPLASFGLTTCLVAIASAQEPTDIPGSAVVTAVLSEQDASKEDIQARLAEIEALRDAGDMRGARERLSELFREEAYSVLAVAERSEAKAAYSAVGDLAKGIGLSALEVRTHRDWLAWLEERHEPDHPDFIEARSALGGALARRADFTAALEEFELVLAALERSLSADDEKVLQAQANVAAMRGSLGDYTGLLEIRRKAHEIHSARLPEGHQTLLSDENNLAWILNRHGKFAEARGLLEHALSISERTLEGDDAAEFLFLLRYNLAGSCNGLGDTERSRELCEEILGSLEREYPSDHPRVLAAKRTLADSLLKADDYVGARGLLEELHGIYEGAVPEDHGDRLWVEYHLGIALFYLRDLDRARVVFEDIHAIYRETLPPGHEKLAAIQGALASVLSRSGDHEAARILFTEALRACEAEAAIPPHVHAKALENLGGTLSALGEAEEATSLLARAIDVRKEHLAASEFDLLLVEQQLTCERWRLGETEFALAEMQRIDRAWELLDSPNNRGALATRTALAQMRMVSGDRRGARDTLGDLYQDLITDADALRAESPRAARAGALSGFSYLNSALPLEEAAAAEGEAARNGVLFSLLESLRQVSTTSTEVAQAVSKSPALRGRRDRLGNARAALSDHGSAPPADAKAVDDWRARLVELAGERDRYERELREALVEADVLTSTPTSEAIAARLEQGAAWVSYYRYPRPVGSDPWRNLRPWCEPALLAFAITPDGAVRRIELGAIAPIEEALGEWRASLGRPLTGRGVPLTAPGTAGDSAEPSERLREWVLDPVLGQLPGVSALHVVLDDVLHLVPLDALLLEENVVGDRLEIRVEPSAMRILLDELPLESEPILVAYGGIDYDAAVEVSGTSLVASPPVASTSMRSGAAGALAPLPGTALEIEAIGDLFSELYDEEPIVRRGAEAHKKQLHSDVRGARFVHLATHGWFADESAFSSLEEESGAMALDGLQQSLDLRRGFAPETLCGLALAGANRGADSRGRVPGILTAEELSILDLTGCELAVLSACETNVGPRRAGQGIQSLQGALHAAGARTAITSLWRVDDAATRRLMELFYAGLWDDGLGKARALWRAKTTLREEGYPTRDWAGWVLTGDPD